MPNVVYDIEILNGLDNRSNEIPIKLVIKNESTERIKVVTIIPNIPDHVLLEEKKDVFQEESKIQFQELCYELTSIANYVLLTSNESYKQTIVKAYSDTLKQVFNNLPTLYKALL